MLQPGGVDVAEVLAELGGVATRAQLEEHVTRTELRCALDGGRVIRPARGRFVLPSVDEARARAHALSATVSLRSAAMVHGWAVKDLPRVPDLTLPRNRRLSGLQGAGVTVHRASLGPDDILRVGGTRVTSTDRTLVDCLRLLPADEALAVADSALRAGVTPARLRRLADGISGPGRPQARRLASQADGRAANPFESVLRCVALGVDGLRVVPQVELWHQAVFLGRPDLVDRDLRIVLEADSFTWHGGRAALAHDCRRYDEMVVAGWMVLRFAYEQVMGEPTWVRRILEEATKERTVRGSRAA